MKILLRVLMMIVLLTNLPTVLSSKSTASSEINKEVFVSYGDDFNPRDYTFVVRVTIAMGPEPKAPYLTCTGSLVTAVFVITAAHCTDTRTESALKVYHYTNTLKNYTKHEVQKIHQHAKYTTQNKAFDITVLKIVGPIYNVEYAKIAGQPSDFDNGKELDCVFIGFGRTETGFSTYPILGYVGYGKVKYGDNACRNHVDQTLHKKKGPWFAKWAYQFLCTVPQKQHTCQGDSGGPLMCNGYLYGICSYLYNFIDAESQNQCGNDQLQTKHLFLYIVYAWIYEHVENKTSTPPPVIVTLSPKATKPSTPEDKTTIPPSTPEDETTIPPSKSKKKPRKRKHKRKKSSSIILHYKLYMIIFALSALCIVRIQILFLK